VDAIITGSVTPFGDNIRVTCKVIATDTARVISAAKIEIAKTRAIDELLSKEINDGGTSKSESNVPQKDEGLEKTQRDYSKNAMTIEDVRGEWEVVADGHKGMWVIGNDGRKIFGASKWTCCPGFRVDRISGQIDGNRVEITRHIIGQGLESGTQTWRGTVQGDRISGSWSGLGG
jgi:hypothetical protein